MSDEPSQRRGGSTDPAGPASGKKPRKQAASTDQKTRLDRSDGAPGSDTEDDPSSRQLTFDDLDARCQAIAASTGEQCKHDAVKPSPYCGDHLYLLDEVDVRQMRLKLSKSGT